jgi:hypothetical protein
MGRTSASNIAGGGDLNPVSFYAAAQEDQEDGARRI